MNTKEFEKLQKLAGLHLASEQQEPMSNTIQSVLAYLKNMQSYAEKCIQAQQKTTLPDTIAMTGEQGQNILSTTSSEALLANAQHPLVARSIAIASFLQDGEEQADSKDH